jgi:hypothetical protein
MCVRKMCAIAVQRNMQLARTGGIHFGAQFAKNAFDVLWQDIIVDQMLKKRVQNFTVVVHKGLG